MKTYQKKPDLVEAVQILDENQEALLAMNGVQALGKGIYAVETGQGNQIAHPGEWIIQNPGDERSRSLLSNGQFATIYQEVK